jgi:catechol 2,3-dioxygenase-like lactoylglutathione lyase family enzyme
MRAWLKGVDVISLFVADVPFSKAFYQQVFDMSVVYEDEDSVVFGFGNLLVNLLAITAAEEVVAPAAIGSREVGSRFMFTIRVPDADAVCAELVGLGTELLNGPVDRAWGVRTASFTDPDGHIWEIAQELPKA